MNLPALLVFAVIFFGLGFFTGFVVFKYGSEPQPPARPADTFPATPVTQIPGPVLAQAEQISPAAQIPAVTGPAVPTSQPQAGSQPAGLPPPFDLPAAPHALTMPVLSQAASSVKPVPLNPLTSAARLLQRTSPPAVKNISGQIDDILQEKIQQAGATYDNLHLVDLADHTLGVILAGKTYPGINEVPDDAARALIRTAVDEWRKRNR